MSRSLSRNPFLFPAYQHRIASLTADSRLSFLDTGPFLLWHIITVVAHHPIDHRSLASSVAQDWVGKTFGA
jgi:hypothetical protein